LFPYRELFQALIRNQVRVVSWHSYGGFFVLACYPPRASFISSCLFRHAASNRSHIASHHWQPTWPLLHSALVQVRFFVVRNTAEAPFRETQKTPRRTARDPFHKRRPLGGRSAVPDRLLSRVSLVCGLRPGPHLTARADSTIGKPARGCQPSRGL
jgi:hypothetical protein